MDLKEAKERLRFLYRENKNTLAVFSTTSKVREDYLKENEAIETILQELDNLQKENEQLRTEVNSLQKENDEIKNVSKEIILETGKIISILQDLLKEE